MMFKTKVEPPRPGPSMSIPAPRPEMRPSGVPTIISADMTIHGDLNSVGDLQIEGTVVGEITVGKLVIAEGGSVEGNINAKTARIAGSLNGSIRCASVTLTATARVFGDVHHELLAIETGGLLEGQSRRIVIEPPPAAEEKPKALSHREDAPVLDSV